MVIGEGENAGLICVVSDEPMVVFCLGSEMAQVILEDNLGAIDFVENTLRLPDTYDGVVEERASRPWRKTGVKQWKVRIGASTREK